MKNIIKKGGWSFVLLCVALVMNHRFGYITMIGIFVLIVIANALQSKMKMDNKGLCILLYCIFYIVLSAINGFTYSLSTLVVCLFAPPIFYCYGKRIVGFCGKEQDILLVWFLIVLCYTIDTIVVGIDSMLTSGEWFASERALSFYEGQVTSATVVGLPLNIGMVGLPLALIMSNKRLKPYYLMLTLCSILVVTYLLTRTGWVILMACLFLLVLIKGLKNKKFLVASVLLFVIGVVILIYSTNVLDSELVNLYSARNEAEGLEVRSDRWIDSVGKLFMHPFGWAEDGEVYYIHNMWLDIARMSGPLPFLLLSGLSVHFLINAFRNALRYNTDTWYLMLGLNLCFFASCFVEPVVGGTHFMLYCMLWGCQSSLDRKCSVL